MLQNAQGIIYKVLTTMEIRPLGDQTYYYYYYMVGDAR